MSLGGGTLDGWVYGWVNGWMERGRGEGGGEGEGGGKREPIVEFLFSDFFFAAEWREPGKGDMGRR